MKPEAAPDREIQLKLYRLPCCGRGVWTSAPGRPRRVRRALQSPIPGLVHARCRTHCGRDAGISRMLGESDAY